MVAFDTLKESQLSKILEQIAIPIRTKTERDVITYTCIAFVANDETIWKKQ